MRSRRFCPRLRRGGRLPVFGARFHGSGVRPREPGGRSVNGSPSSWFYSVLAISGSCFPTTTNFVTRPGDRFIPSSQPKRPRVSSLLEIFTILFDQLNLEPTH